MSGTLTESLAHLFVLGCFGEGKSAAFGWSFVDLASCVEDVLIAVADEVIELRCSLLQRMSLYLGT